MSLHLDEKVRSEVWNGAIPVMFILDPNEVCTPTPPAPFYAMIRRVGYFSFVCSSLFNHFSSSALITPHNTTTTTATQNTRQSIDAADSSSGTNGKSANGGGASLGLDAIANEMWLEAADTPLRWQLPVGVLFDSLHANNFKQQQSQQSQQSQQQQQQQQQQHSYPWIITVHFRNFPHSLMHCASLQEMEWAYVNSLKEAMFLCHGTSKAVMSLPKESQQQLFQSIKDGNYRQFWLVNHQVRESGGSSHVYKNLPIRFVFPNTNHTFVQQPCSPLDANGQEHTLRSYLTQLIPPLVTSQRVTANTTNTPSSNSSRAYNNRFSNFGDSSSTAKKLANQNFDQDGTRASAGSGAGGDFGEDQDDNGMVCIVQGVRVCLDVPLVWLANHCACADNFVYVVTLISPTAVAECFAGAWA